MTPAPRISAVLAAIVLVLCFAPLAGAASIPRLSLLPEVAVAGPGISLCDLLPLDAPALVREKAAEVSLGAAPQLGSTRILDRTFIEHAIAADFGVLPALAVPQRVLVSRNIRLIDPQEVFRAVRDSLKAAKSSAADSLRPEDVTVQAQVFVAAGDPGLKVVEARPDAPSHGAVFRIAAANEPEVLPFYVSVRLAAGSPSLSHSTAESSLPRPRQAIASPVSRAFAIQPPQFLIAPGRRVTLNLQSDALHMILDVLCLDRGAMGQPVRVRLESGKILTATVDGPAHVSGRL